MNLKIWIKLIKFTWSSHASLQFDQKQVTNVNEPIMEIEIGRSEDLGDSLFDILKKQVKKYIIYLFIAFWSWFIIILVDV